MKTYLDCIPCFMQQAFRAGQIATSDEKKIKTDEWQKMIAPALCEKKIRLSYD